jgi:hypothetical protein
VKRNNSDRPASRSSEALIRATQRSPAKARTGTPCQIAYELGARWLLPARPQPPGSCHA